MTDQPLTPTRITPGPVNLPDRPPADGELPPWWEQPAPEAPPAPPADAPSPPAAPPLSGPEAPPQIVEVRVTQDQAQQTEPEPEPAPRWSLAWARHHLHPWATLTGATLAVTPMPWTGYSAATTWAYTVSEARDQFGYGWGYALAGGLLAVAVLADHRGRSWRLVTRFWLTVGLLGFLGAIHWYDPITLITGVQP